MKWPRIKRRDQETIIVLGGTLLALSLLPFFRDPYYHKENVSFWVWAEREIEELRTGERE